MVDTAVILAGGLGTRLQPLTLHTPKPLLPLNGKPILGHIITQLQKHGVTKIIISVGYKADQIRDCFGDGSSYGLSIRYVVETKPLGTGGAVKQAARGLTEPFLLLWGDNLTDIDSFDSKFYSSDVIGLVKSNNDRLIRGGCAGVF